MSTVPDFLQLRCRLFNLSFPTALLSCCTIRRHIGAEWYETISFWAVRIDIMTFSMKHAPNNTDMDSVYKMRYAT